MLDTSTASLARAWDYLLGGGASFAADRALALRLEALYPEIREVLFASRAYAADAVAGIASAGVRQFLDIGAGLPTRPSTHETARVISPGARVAYVDHDPVAAEHGRALVPAGVRYLQGELAEPEAILAHDDLAGLIDFSRRPAWCSPSSCTCSTRARHGPSSASSSARWPLAATWW